MFVAESEMSGTRTVRQADAAVCLPELSGFAIQLINIGHIKAKITDQDFIPLCIKNSKMRMRPLLPVRRIITDTAIPAEVAERTEPAI